MNPNTGATEKEKPKGDTGVVFIKNHTHAGRIYEKGDKLEVSELDKQQLKRLGVI